VSEDHLLKIREERIEEHKQLIDTVQNILNVRKSHILNATQDCNYKNKKKKE
jgi:hypothetical protein